MERRLAAVLVADMAAYSRLMEQDEEGVLERQSQYRRELIDPEIARSGGHVIKSTGDGMLVEFDSVQKAVQCALQFQTVIAEREVLNPKDVRILYRVGINLGDVIFDDGDIFGNGVNVAARLEGISEPGSVCVSDIVNQLIADRLDDPFEDIGRHFIKNISKPVRVWQWTPNALSHDERSPKNPLGQRVHFATASDSVQIAWASIGEGQPVLKAPNWSNHIEHDWQHPFWNAVLRELSGYCRFVRFDQRGSGLSDWGIKEFTEDAIIGDMATVVRVADLERFAILGISQGCPYAVRYAVENPEQITCLVLLSGFVRGRLKRPHPEQGPLFETMNIALSRAWGSSNPVFRHLIASNYFPDAQPETLSKLFDWQRMATDRDNALRNWELNSAIDATDLAKQVRVPALVLNCRGDGVVPIEEGRLMAGLIRGSDFVELAGNNHVPLPGTPEFEEFVQLTGSFLAEHNK